MSKTSTKPCVKCGAADRNASGHCRPCAKRLIEDWRARRTSSYCAQVRVRERKRSAARYRANPVAAHARQLKRKYGVSAAEYRDQLEAQGGVCAICREPETAVDKNKKVKLLSVDHCHKTGTARGLLCDACNKALGGFKDSPTILRAATSYLEASR